MGRWDDMTSAERDRWIGRGLTLSWILIALTCLILYGLIVVAVWHA